MGDGRSGWGSSTKTQQSGNSDTELKNCAKNTEIIRLLQRPGQEIGTVGRREVPEKLYRVSPWGSSAAGTWSKYISEGKAGPSWVRKYHKWYTASWLTSLTWSFLLSLPESMKCYLVSKTTFDSRPEQVLGPCAVSIAFGITERGTCKHQSNCLRNSRFLYQTVIPMRVGEFCLLLFALTRHDS